MHYCDIDGILATLSERELINLTNDITPASEVNMEIFNTCAEFADELINASLRNKYGLPLSFVPLLVESLARDITAYRLYSRRPIKMPEQIKENYENSLNILSKLQKGTIVLDLPSEHKDEVVASTSSAILTNKRKSDRRFTDEVLKGFF